ncbi:MAG: hypothetical protein L3J06_06540 [Cyclobacteriaceae bacterium]|nr:hypothetical protein [Cyclobacteriaceae bacterium]
MKNRIIFIVMMGLINLQGYAQLSIAPSESFAVCPDEWITYVVSNTDPFGCSYDWSVTNGEIDGNPNGDTANIKWSNTADNGSLTISSINCNTSAGEATKSWGFSILSINGETPSSITGASSVAANITTNKVYEVDQINFPNIGSGDVSPYEVSDYEWQLPTGWTVVSGGTTKKITVKPDAFSEGDIRVRGKNTNCQNGPFFTNWSPVLPRTVATPGTITGNNGNNFVVCGDT